MLLSLRSNPQTMSSYIHESDGLCTRTDHHMLLPIVLHMVVPLCCKLIKSMYKYWGLHISTDTNCLEVFLGSFWAVWRGLLLSLEPKLRSWQFPRYWQFNKQYYGGYQLICLISRPILIASRCDWYQSKGLFKGFS